MLSEVLARFAQGALSPSWALTELLSVADDLTSAEAFLRGREGDDRARQLLRLLAEHRAGGECMVRMARAHAILEESVPNESAIDRCARFFDWSVDQNEEASVALYSLGSAELLADATDEVVRLLGRWSALGLDRDVLQIGCGIGRVECAISPRVRTATGVDVSARMIEVAKRRTASLPNVHIALTDGRGLDSFADGHFDTVFAVDTFPYLVLGGEPLVQRHFAEIRRVLEPGGVFAILNYSYRGDPADDHGDVLRLARANGFTVDICGGADGTMWNGCAYRMTAD